MPAVYEDGHVRIVRFDEPLSIAINGRSGLGIVVKPEAELNDLSQTMILQ